ncbi:hypothetical protein B484DRAFT_453187 [Ochromonadaceae sp. CCMP2298]|nr:hypothetical protein B484DRAFT_453187 [Ochromonadaceae sp. CCMP2298]
MLCMLGSSGRRSKRSSPCTESESFDLPVTSSMEWTPSTWRRRFSTVMNPITSSLLVSSVTCRMCCFGSVPSSWKMLPSSIPKRFSFSIVLARSSCSCGPSSSPLLSMISLMRRSSSSFFFTSKWCFSDACFFPISDLYLAAKYLYVSLTNPGTYIQVLE